MADKIYYKVQYPMKKAIEKLRKLETDEQKLKKEVENLTETEKGMIKDFIIDWENKNKEKLENFIQKLKEENI
ncbi:MAG: hypothetical protein ABR596_02245 [Halarsenatibacteraceae bacterium]